MNLVRQDHSPSIPEYRGFGVYVHVPYCSSRCGYCDFNTYVASPDQLAEFGDRWAQGIVHEIDNHRSATDLAVDRPIDTVFFGGGTPTLLPVQALDTVLRALAERCGIAVDAEITVEANPETVSTRLLEELLAAGVNRISVGMQSADPGVLATLEREHRPGGALQAVELAQAAGFSRCSLDLIYGTPGETVESWDRTVLDALSTGVGHVSAYALSVEPSTAMGRRVKRHELLPPDPDDAATKYEVVDELLSAAGLQWYEVSNWARPGEECRHNLGYWRGDDWWGLGPGAHGHVRGLRYSTHKLPSRWLAGARAGSTLAASERLGEDEQHTERVMLGTRLREGLDPALVPPAAVRRLVEDGLVQAGDSVRLTRRGRLLGDTVVLALLGD